MQPDKIPLMSFNLIDRVIEKYNRQKVEESGGHVHEWGTAPEYENPDGPPDREHFVYYAMGLGFSQEWAEKEFAKQLERGGADLSWLTKLNSRSPTP